MLSEKVMMKDFDLITCKLCKKVMFGYDEGFWIVYWCKDSLRSSQQYAITYNVKRLIIIDINVITNNYNSSLHTKVYHYRRC